MGRLLLLALIFSWLLGCTQDDPEALFIDLAYQVRCVDCDPRANDDPARAIHNVDGEEGLTLTCSVIERGGERLVSFAIEHTDSETNSVDYSLSVDQASLDSKDPGSGCRVRAKEGSNTYEGLCTGDDPSDETPCSLTDLKQSGNGVTGSLHCVHIPNKAQPELTRHIAAPSSTKAAKFEVTGCGL
jgi:hypothetical protein